MKENYKVTKNGLNFMMLYEIKKISKWILLISIVNLIINLIQMISKLG